VRQDVSTVYSEQTSYRERTDARKAHLEKDMKTVEQAIGTPDSGLRKQVVDMSLTDEARDAKIKEILGRLDELESQLRTYWSEVRGELKDLKAAQQPAAQNPVQGPVQDQVQPQDQPAAKTNTDDSYKRGFDAFQKGSYNEALPLFAQYVKENRDAPLVPNAYFWMGESYMNMKNYEKAILQFQDVIERFPKSDKAPKAMLRQAEAFAGLGDKKSSTTLLRRVVELYPKSEEARVATRELRGNGLLQ
jgi:tol-pal system protein YbgF